MSNGPESVGDNRPYTVALTGGIASGKTLVSDAFKKLGVPVVDTDVIARELVKPGQPALKEIKKAFGSKIIDNSGQLKRSEMRSIIFSDPEERLKLETILHPRIRHEASKAVANVSSPYCILVIPLLVEKGVYPYIDRVLVVDADPEVQISRLMARDNISRQLAERALTSQASREQRLLIADDVITNSGSPEQTHQLVKQLHYKFVKLAAKR